MAYCSQQHLLIPLLALLPRPSARSLEQLVLHILLMCTFAQADAGIHSLRSAEEMAATLEKLYSERAATGGDSSLRDPADIFGDLQQLKDDLAGLTGEVSRAGAILGPVDPAPVSELQVAFGGADEVSIQVRTPHTRHDRVLAWLTFFFN